MRFSQRQGITPSTKSIQLEDMDAELQNSLWNAIKIFIIDPLEKYTSYSGGTQFEKFCKVLWNHYYKEPIDTIPYHVSDKEAVIRKHFFSAEWFEVYDLLEFFTCLDQRHFQLDLTNYVVYCNEILEREFAGYRFLEEKVVPITNQNELSEIESALNESSQLTALKGVNIHLKEAINKLSDKKAPDYRNSIKESVSAVESMAKAISGKTNDTLGSALDRIKGKVNLHQALEKGFKQLYGYASDSDGIRHSLMEDSNCSFEDAKYMLVSCSAFINYLVVKANKSGIQF